MRQLLGTKRLGTKSIGLIVKLTAMGMVNGFTIWAVPVLWSHKTYSFAIYFLVSTIAVDIIYFAKGRFIPGKYMAPGIFLLLMFQVYPALYTGYVAFTNFSTGHFIDKTTAIDTIVSNSYMPTSDTDVYTMTVAKDTSGKLSMILQKPDGTIVGGNAQGSRVLSPADVTLNDKKVVVAAKGYKIFSEKEFNDNIDAITNLKVPLADGSGAVAEAVDLNRAQKLLQKFKYDKSKDEIINIQDGTIYKPNNYGEMVAPGQDALEPGWTTTIGWQNFSKIIHDQSFRKPLAAVLTWTFAYAFLVVAMTFFLGLLLALALNHPKLKAKRLYRSLLIVPYAMPGVLAALVWAGMYSTDGGVINRLLGAHIPWLEHPWWAKAAILIQQLWAGSPYMFLISTGAIQSLSPDIVEAASVDGASGWQVFSKIKLPLILLTLSPLLIASYAYNFSNFGAIYLLTGGGPVMLSSGGIAGHTDILISYTYKLAFSSGKGSEYGLASAVSFLNFLIVATLSIYGFRKSRSMENMN